MKKILKAVLIGIFIFSIIIPNFSIAAEGDVVQVGDLFLEIVSEEEKTVRVVKDSSYKELTSITIPSKVQINGQEYSVIAIYGSSFSDCTNLRTAIIEDGIQEVGSNVFSRCYNLEEVKLPEGITKMSSFLFCDCTSLKSFNIPTTVETIEWYAFWNCTSIEKVTIPANVKQIGDFAFFECTNLKEVVLEEGVVGLGNYMLSGCTSLTDITIPSTTKGFGNDIFLDCPETFVVHVRENTVADTYATENGFNIEYIIVPIESIEIVGISTMEIGDTQKLTTTKYPSDYTTSSSVRWTSSNPDVATISSTSGKVTAKAEGTTIITATIDGVSNTFKIEVINTSFLKGDINNDGKITTGDLSYGLARLTGTPITEDEIQRGDVTGDGKYTTGDLSKLMKYLTGGINEL